MVFADNAEELLTLAVEKAKTEKSGTMLRALLPFIAAPLKDRGFSPFELPEITSADDVTLCLDKIAQAMAGGLITEPEAKTLTVWAGARLEAFKVTHLAKQLEELKLKVVK